MSSLVEAGTALLRAGHFAAAERLLYRAAQEGLRNALVHGDPSSVRITLRQTLTEATLTVCDDGRGVDEATLTERQAAGHVGLVALRGLLSDAGGSLQVTPGGDGGTELRATVPIR